MALNLAAKTALTLRTYTGPERESATVRTRRPYNGHYLHTAAKMQPHPETGDGNHSVEVLKLGNFSMWTADLKWSDLEPEEGIYDLGQIRALTDVLTEQRVFSGLNFEWKHFSCEKYANVVPEWMTEVATGAWSFNYTGGAAVSGTDTGTLVYVGASFATATAKGVLNQADSASATDATGFMVIDRTSGTFANGDVIKIYGTNTTLCTISTAPSARTGTQVGMGQDGLHTKIWEKYVSDKMRKLLEEIMRQFGHHPWFAAIEGAETAGVTTKDGGAMKLYAVNYSNNSTWKWQGNRNAMLTVVDTIGNTFLDTPENGLPGKSYVLFYGRLCRDMAKLYPSITWIGSWNMLPAWAGEKGHQLGYDYMTRCDGVVTEPSLNLAVGGPDILYEHPKLGAPNKNVFPFCRADANGKGFDDDGEILQTASGTWGSLRYARLRHKFAMQHDSHKTAENGGLTLENLWKWGRDYMNLHMIQWNYQKGNYQYNFIDQKQVISGAGDHLLTAGAQPDPITGVSERAAVKTLIQGYFAKGKKFTVKGIHDAVTTTYNVFPPQGSGVVNAFSVGLTFSISNWGIAGTKILWRSDSTVLSYNGGTVTLTYSNGAISVTNTITKLAANNIGAKAFVNFSVGRYKINDSVIRSENRVHLYVKNSLGGLDGGTASPKGAVVSTGGTVEILNDTIFNIEDGCIVLKRQLAGIPSNDGSYTRELKSYSPSKPIG